MIVSFYRKGYANNSSSMHSVIFAPSLSIEDDNCEAKKLLKNLPQPNSNWQTTLEIEELSTRLDTTEEVTDE